MDKINSTRPVGKALPKHAAIMFRIAEKIKHVRLVGVVSSSIMVSHKLLQSGLFLRGNYRLTDYQNIISLKWRWTVSALQ